MTPQEFSYWLQGFVELSGEIPTQNQWQVIKDHLALVFKKETPVYSPDPGLPQWPSDIVPIPFTFMPTTCGKPTDVDTVFIC